MKRPQLIHFTSIETSDWVSVRASATYVQTHYNDLEWIPINEETPQAPFKKFNWRSGHTFNFLIKGLDRDQNEIFQRNFDSDSYGNIDIRIAKNQEMPEINCLQVFETKMFPGLEILLGNFIPIRLSSPMKIVITDFDKTLIDTRYSTTIDLYKSLTKPLNYFPAVKGSLDLYKKYINQGNQPFVLTASPHFYEEAIRNWLYKNDIYTAGIFLKDYRKIFSLWDYDLSTKDIKKQGFYKLNHLVNILRMTGIPDELIFIGDAHESDTLIYLTVASLLNNDLGPWELWNHLKNDQAFQLTAYQNSRFLNKLYQIHNLNKDERPNRTKIKIYIRCLPNQKEISIKIPQLKKNLELVEFFKA